MKKSIVILLGMILLAGCSKQSEEEPNAFLDGEVTPKQVVKQVTKTTIKIVPNSDGKKLFIKDLHQYISVARGIDHTTVNYKMSILDGLSEAARNKINLIHEKGEARLIEIYLITSGQASIAMFQNEIDIYSMTRDESKWKKLLDRIGNYSRYMKHSINVLELMVYAYENNKDVHDVLDTHRKPLYSFLDNATEILEIGSTYVHSKQYVEAINAFKKAITIKPDFTQAYCALGLTHYQLKQYKEAIIACKKGLTINSKLKSGYGLTEEMGGEIRKLITEMENEMR
ncbi:MAG: tetratricopeptide repeat protein [Candidatus Scalindua sp.]|jgi:tetratricopeptide (TPR) repeat protein|nr:tetratricopeptide repeat protein [Candidatus Scalindua sp.]